MAITRAASLPLLFKPGAPTPTTLAAIIRALNPPPQSQLLPAGSNVPIPLPFRAKQELKMNTSISTMTALSSDAARQKILGCFTPSPNSDPMVLGHRGLRMNVTPDEVVRENTVLSLCKAAEAGAKWVEFDVQMTADDELVLWHDDELLTMADDGNVTSYPIGELTLAQFRELASGRHTTHNKVDCQLARVFKHSPFHKQLGAVRWPYQNGGEPCTLKEALQGTPATVGFDIELKFDSRRLSTEAERSELLDKTLSVLREFADARPVLFSSFDPMACVEMRQKQDAWPVLMLTCMGDQEPDLRQRSLKAAVEVALQHNLDGVIADSGNPRFFDDLRSVQRLLFSGKHLLTYGHGNVDPEIIVKQVAIGVGAMCTDNITVCSATVTTTRLLQGLRNETDWLRAALFNDTPEKKPLPLPLPTPAPATQPVAPRLAPIGVM